MANIDQVMGGLTILKKYVKDGNNDVEGQHDIIFAAPGVGEDDLSPEDKIEILKLGWHFDEDGECWSRFT